MTLSDVISVVAYKTGRLWAKQVVLAFIEELGNAVESSGRLVVPGLGTFTIRRRKARWVRDVHSGLRMFLPAQESICFRASVNRKRKVKEVP